MKRDEQMKKEEKENKIKKKKNKRESNESGSAYTAEQNVPNALKFKWDAIGDERNWDWCLAWVCFHRQSKHAQKHRGVKPRT